MMILEEQTVIEASPEDVFHFFEQLDEEAYRAWHPDHVTYRLIEGERLEAGTIAYFEERRGGKDIKMNVLYRRVEPNRYIEFSPTSRFYRIFLPQMSFGVEPHNGQSLLTTRVHVRTGPIGAWLNRKEFDAVRQHMKEEGHNLKKILEQSD
jgi:uncharacterized protein YndB with AHSA1/START domain